MMRHWPKLVVLLLAIATYSGGDWFAVAADSNANLESGNSKVDSSAAEPISAAYILISWFPYILGLIVSIVIAIKFYGSKSPMVTAMKNQNEILERISERLESDMKKNNPWKS